MVIILEILPNIFWMYNNTSSTNNVNNVNNVNNEYNVVLHKQCELLNIKKLLILDEYFDKISWGKSNQYINITEIKNEMEKHEFSKLLNILIKLNDLIKKLYVNNEPLLISTFKHEYIELGLSVWIYFFYINANISLDNIIKLLSVKIIGNIILTDELKKFFAFLNLKKK